MNRYAFPAVLMLLVLGLAPARADYEVGDCAADESGFCWYEENTGGEDAHGCDPQRDETRGNRSDVGIHVGTAGINVGGTKNCQSIGTGRPPVTHRGITVFVQAEPVGRLYVLRWEQYTNASGDASETRIEVLGSQKWTSGSSCTFVVGEPTVGCPLGDAPPPPERPWGQYYWCHGHPPTNAYEDAVDCLAENEPQRAQDDVAWYTAWAIQRASDLTP